jgi:hypothetical protein
VLPCSDKIAARRDVRNGRQRALQGHAATGIGFDD